MDQLLDRAPCGFISFGDDSKILLVNSTLLERLGYSREEIAGKPFEELLTVGGKIFHQTHFFPLIKLHGLAREVFLLLRAKGGESVGVLCNAKRVERDGSHHIDCVMMEVVERRKFEEALLEARKVAEHANEMLEEQAVELELQQQLLQEQTAELEEQKAAADQANLAKSNFLAVMSHELRTPLNAIGGYVQLLGMGVHGPVTPQQQEALDRIDRSQRHLLRLINDVLNLSRIEAGRVDYVVTPVSLAGIVLSVMPMVEPQIEAKGVTLQNAVPRKLDAKGDRDKVQQVLLNILTNAVKFTAAGGTICVEGNHDATHAYLRVVDSGMGIPEEMLEKIFEPFVQVDASKSRATEGTGLGLAISRDLARGMGGDLTVESTVGSGSTFQLSLPR